MQKYPRWLSSSLVALGLCAAGCAPTAPEAEPTGLRGVEIPDGFDFATTRGVRLTADVPEGTRLEVQLPGGAVIYRGPTPAQHLELSVPTKDTRLEVTTTYAGATRHHSVRVEAGAAHLKVEG